MTFFGASFRDAFVWCCSVHASASFAGWKLWSWVLRLGGELLEPRVMRSSAGKICMAIDLAISHRDEEIVDAVGRRMKIGGFEARAFGQVTRLR